MSQPINYYVGVDPALPLRNSNAALVVFKVHENGCHEFVKGFRWYQKFNWINKLRFKFFVFTLSRYYSHTVILKEKS